MTSRSAALFRTFGGILFHGLLLAALPWPSQAADFTCRAEVNRTTVPQGGNVALTVTGEGDIGWSADFTLPDLPSVTVQSGGVNQSMTVVNGKSRTSVARTWYLTVHEKANFTIGPVAVTAEGETCRTEAIDIVVTDPKPAASVPPTHTGNRVPPPAGSTGSTAGHVGDDIFVTLSVDHEEAWVGQQLILYFRYYRRVQPWNRPDYMPPRAEGFWREGLGPEKNFRQVVQGRAYSVTEIRYALFPTRSGDLVVEPAELVFPENIADRFFSTRRRNSGPRVLRTDSLKITVKDLPLPKPEGFTGLAASRCDLRATVDRDTVPRGEAIGFRLQLESDGFLKGFPGMTVPAPVGARLHDATENFSSVPGDGRMSWRVVQEKVIIPGEEGLLRIPPVQLHWFDVNKGRYRTASTHLAEVVVTPSDLPFAGTEESGFLRQELSRLGDDLAFIHQVPENLDRRENPWTGGVFWWVFLLAPAALLVGYRVILDRMAASRLNPAAQRRRQALPRARQRLSEAAGEHDPAERWALVARAIVEFVADSRDLPPASVGSAEVLEFCRARGMEEEGNRLAVLLESSDAARYGGEAVFEDSTGDVAHLLARLDGVADLSSGRTDPGVVAGLLVTVLAVGLLLSTVPAVAAESTTPARPGTDPVRLVAEGNQAYTSGDLAEALGLYLQARDLGVNDAVLHYNLGNAQARSGQLGSAVASYLRARRLNPRDDDIKANLVWVRRHLKDLELTEDQWPLFIAQLVAIVEALTLDQWGLVLVLCVWLVAGLVAWAWWRDDFGSRLRRVVLASIGLLIVVAAVTFGRWHHEQVRNEAVVIAEVDVRSGPAENFPVLFKVHDGLTVEIEEWRQGWVRIGMGGDWGGWLPTHSIEAVRLDPTQGR